jgi:hypothetical protein
MVLLSLEAGVPVGEGGHEPLTSSRFTSGSLPPQDGHISSGDTGVQSITLAHRSVRLRNRAFKALPGERK